MPSAYSYELFSLVLDTLDDDGEFCRAEAQAGRFLDELAAKGFASGGHVRDVGTVAPFRDREMAATLYQSLHRGDALFIRRPDAVFGSLKDAASTLSGLRRRGVVVYLGWPPREAEDSDPSFWERLDSSIRSRRAKEGWVGLKKSGYQPKYLHLNCPFGFRPQEVDGKLIAVECPQAREAAR